MPAGIYFHKPHTEERKKKISLAMKGEKNHFYGKHHSVETRKKISQAKLGRKSPGSGIYIRTEEMRRNIGEGHKGEKHYNWKGGSKNLERVRFRDTMQKLIFERDDYTCQLCRIRGVDLQVDHIQSWAEYVELRFSMENCRTLCAKCHYKITFGRPMPKSVKTWGHNLKVRMLC